MDSAILPWIFAVVLCAALIVFLWDIVLGMAKEQLKPRDLNTAKFFLFLLSLTLLVVAVHYGGSILHSLFSSDGPV
jgi:cytochrome c oxidase assembly factor CtaG